MNCISLSYFKQNGKLYSFPNIGKPFFEISLIKTRIGGVEYVCSIGEYMEYSYNKRPFTTSDSNWKNPGYSMTPCKVWAYYNNNSL